MRTEKSTPGNNLHHENAFLTLLGDTETIVPEIRTMSWPHRALGQSQRILFLANLVVRQTLHGEQEGAGFLESGLAIVGNKLSLDRGIISLLENHIIQRTRSNAIARLRLCV